jgi:chromosome segregation ATPase
MGSESSHCNYFNYFTEIEEHFQRARGSGLFLLSPVDWALIEGWKNSGVPLEAVLRGIDAAFEKWRSRKQKFQQVNSIAYCTQAVMAEANAMADAGTVVRTRQVEAPFTLEELRAHLERNAAKLHGREEYSDVASALKRLAAEAEAHYGDLEQLEQRLTALEEKMSAIVKARESEEDLYTVRRELDLSLKPYRGKMSAEQIAMLERQYLERRLLEAAGLPRLSLFYLA